MVFITEDLVRKRSEHNNYEISTLEELSLHQQDIEAIDNLDKWCKKLKILYLQSNLISKIENVGKLKQLEYLNLALNNVSRIENLAGCESLNKLDLTVNFIAELTSVESLKRNEFFKELYLTGNPCTQFEGYREYVIATLPQLKQLDGREVERSERILATQRYSELRDSILQQQEIYNKNQRKQKERKENKDKNDQWYTDTTTNTKCENVLEDQPDCSEEISEDEKEKKYWSERTEYTPESRVEMHNHIKEQNELKEKQKMKNTEPNPSARQVRFFKDDGEPLNVNTSKIQFILHDKEEEGMYVLDVHCYKYMDTSLIDVDVQPKYVRVVIKGKFLQIVLLEKVNPDKCVAQRSETTGHLLVKMPKSSDVIHGKARKGKNKSVFKPSDDNRKLTQTLDGGQTSQSNVKKDTLSLSDLADIVKDRPVENKIESFKSKKIEPEPVDFVDDPDVPPLI
eukprot:gene16160-17783_t